MKPGCLLFIFMLTAHSFAAQSNKIPVNDLTIESYIDFTKHGAEPAYWVTYDHKEISAEIRYGYDLKKNVSIYAGPLLRYKNWKIRILQGLTFGNKTGFSFSPTAILDTKKFYAWNQPQYVIGLSDMPSNFSHWGEFYYKVVKWAWVGITDRFYADKTSNDFGIGPQLLLAYKDWFVTFYWWIPFKKTDNKFFLDGGYEHEF